VSFQQEVQVKDGATPAINRLLELGRKSDMDAVGRGSVRFIQRHLRTNPKNRRGWPTTNFWPQAVRSGQHVATNNSTTVSFGPRGLAQHIFGGTIRKKDKKLTIPVAAEAYGKRAGDFSDLQLVVIKGKGAWLAKRTFETLARTKAGGVSRRGKGAKVERERLKFLFILKDEVTQTGHRERFPSFGDISADALQTLGGRAARRFKGESLGGEA
jgi:hypothetical protein